MTPLVRDRLLGGTLLVVAVAWIVASNLAIPNGYSGSQFGPRSFPVSLGYMLAFLAVIVLVETFWKPDTSAAPADSDEIPTTQREEVWSSAATFGFLITYFIAMQLVGFTLSTIVVVAAFLWIVLGKRSPLLIAGMSLGLGFGLYLLMGRLLGVYLPSGMVSWGF